MNCENCGKEHDGSYGSGRFCCEHCRRQWCGKQKLNKTNNLPNNTKEGGWKCPYCEEVFRTRKEKQQHVREVHRKMSSVAWNKGLTKETSPIIAKQTETWKKRLLEGAFKPPFQGRKHTDETKKQISNSRKKFLEEHPDMIPYKLNHKANGESYPEKYFRTWLESEGINFQQEFRFRLYSFDFLINGNIDLEIDGDQHYCDQRILEHDKVRNRNVEEAGYKVIRVSWSSFKSLSETQKTVFLSELKSKLL